MESPVTILFSSEVQQNIFHVHLRRPHPVWVDIVYQAKFHLTVLAVWFYYVITTFIMEQIEDILGTFCCIHFIFTIIFI